MKKETYLGLLIFCAICSQGVAIISNENIDKSSDLHKRKKRVINNSVGGVQPAHISLSRHLVQIESYGKIECSGTILQSNMIITARSCLLESDEKYTILSGSLTRKDGTPHQVVHSVKLLHNNLALAKIHPPIHLSPHGFSNLIHVAEGNIPPNSSGLFSGWGCTKISSSGGHSYPQQLMATLLPIISVKECKRAIISSNGQVPHSSVDIICTLDPHGERGACYGDEGGSLVYGGRLIGIYAPIGRVNIGVHPDVFMSLNDQNIIQWINHYKSVFQNINHP